MQRTFTPGFTFDDVLLIPKHSTVESRDDVDLSVQLPKGITLKIPLVSANMKSVTGVHMAKTIKELGGLALLHRFYYDYNDIKNDWNTADEYPGPGAVGVSIGIKEKDYTFAIDIYNAG